MRDDSSFAKVRYISVLLSSMAFQSGSFVVGGLANAELPCLPAARKVSAPSANTRLGVILRPTTGFIIHQQINKLEKTEASYHGVTQTGWSLGIPLL